MAELGGGESSDAEVAASRGEDSDSYLKREEFRGETAMQGGVEVRWWQWRTGQGLSFYFSFCFSLVIFVVKMSFEDGWGYIKMGVEDGLWQFFVVVRGEGEGWLWVIHDEEERLFWFIHFIFFMKKMEDEVENEIKWWRVVWDFSSEAPPFPL